MGALLALPAPALAQGGPEDPFDVPPPTQAPQVPDRGGNGGGADPEQGGGGADGTARGGDGATAGDGTRGSLPATGSEPLLLAFLGASLVLGGTGLRLRTLDPDDF